MNISKIEASLKHGRLFTGKWMAFIYFSLSIMLLLPTITILMLILTFTIGMEWDGVMICALIGCNIFVGLISTVFIICIVRNKKLRQKHNFRNSNLQIVCILLGSCL